MNADALTLASIAATQFGLRCSIADELPTELRIDLIGGDGFVYVQHYATVTHGALRTTTANAGKLYPSGHFTI